MKACLAAGGSDQALSSCDAVWSVFPVLQDRLVIDIQVNAPRVVIPIVTVGCADRWKGISMARNDLLSAIMLTQASSPALFLNLCPLWSQFFDEIGGTLLDSAPTPSTTLWLCMLMATAYLVILRIRYSGDGF